MRLVTLRCWFAFVAVSAVTVVTFGLVPGSTVTLLLLIYVTFGLRSFAFVVVVVVTVSGYCHVSSGFGLVLVGLVLWFHYVPRWILLLPRFTFGSLVR